jgi:SAM-dependent methyltransferase
MSEKRRVTHGNYEDRVRAEAVTFSEQENVHDLPPAYDHWSERFVRPLFTELGIQSLHHFFTDPMVERVQDDGTVVVLSVGSGNGDLELGWFKTVAAAGGQLHLRLLELNERMQQRALAAAQALGVADNVEVLVADFNTWKADRTHDVVVANHSLHHVTELEHLFDQLRFALAEDGVILVNDIIGRDGHRRWPEALDVVNRVWASLPPQLRRNSITGEVDDVFPDVDCAEDGFEGIRSQDVLPLLLERFHPGLFVAFANVIDPFVDRIYGANFDLADPTHLQLIDRLGRLDESLCDLGLTTPTHLVASFAPRLQALRSARGRDPWTCVRPPGPVDVSGQVVVEPLRGRAVTVGEGLVEAARSRGVFDDGWCAPTVELALLVTVLCQGLEVSLYRPDGCTPGWVTPSLNGVFRDPFAAGPGLTRYVVPGRATGTVRLGLAADWTVPTTPDSDGVERDRRRMSYVLSEVRVVSEIIAGEEPPSSPTRGPAT